MDFKYFSTVADAPSIDQLVITPSDATVLAPPVRAIYVGGAGDVSIVNAAGKTITFVGVLGGSILPVAALRIRATGTTATALVGLI